MPPPPPTTHFVNRVFEFDSAPGLQKDNLFKNIPTYKPVDEIMEPKWWTGTPPIEASKFVIDCGGNKPVLDEAFKQRCRDIYNTHGLILLKNTGMTDLEEMKPFMYDTVMTKTMAYEAGANHREQLDPYFLEVGAPYTSWLHYHHEMCYVSKSTKSIGFACKDALGGLRGSTFIADSIAATEKILKTPLGQKLKEKGVCYIRILNDEEAYRGEDSSNVFNHWQKSMGTNSREEAEAKAVAMNHKVEWGTDSRGKPNCMFTRYYTSAFEYCPHLDRNVLYTSMANDEVWFDTWPGISDLAPKDRPLQMCFGDDTPFSPEETQEFIDLFDEFGMPIEWQVGDIAILDNYRWVHGRPAFMAQEGEARTLGVVLGETYDRVGVKDGKW